MNKIVICIVLTLISLMIGIGSFVINDISSYRHWMQDNHGHISEHFNHFDRGSMGIPPDRRGIDRNGIPGQTMGKDSPRGPMMGRPERSTEENKETHETQNPEQRNKN